MKNVTRRNFIGTGTLAVTMGALLGKGYAMCKKQPPVSTLGKTANTKFSVNVEMWWTDLPFHERIQKAADLGFPAIEFWSYEGKDLDAIKSTCDQLGLSC